VVILQASLDLILAAGAEPERSGEPDGIDHGPKQSLSPSQQVALEELADRVNAARSVV
jgi:hypothetical protein